MKKYINPRNNRLMKPLMVYAENNTEVLVRFEAFGSDFVIDKNTLVARVVTSRQFENVFDRVK